MKTNKIIYNLYVTLLNLKYIIKLIYRQPRKTIDRPFILDTVIKVVNIPVKSQTTWYRLSDPSEYIYCECEADTKQFYKHTYTQIYERSTFNLPPLVPIVVHRSFFTFHTFFVLLCHVPVLSISCVFPTCVSRYTSAFFFELALLLLLILLRHPAKNDTLFTIWVQQTFL